MRSLVSLAPRPAFCPYLSVRTHVRPSHEPELVIPRVTGGGRVVRGASNSKDLCRHRHRGARARHRLAAVSRVPRSEVASCFGSESDSVSFGQWKLCENHRLRLSENNKTKGCSHSILYSELSAPRGVACAYLRAKDAHALHKPESRCKVPPA